MIGYIYFFSFILFGLLIAQRNFYEIPGILQVWLGGLFGLLGMMWLFVPIALIYGFTIFTHLLAFIIMGTFSLLWFFLFPKPKTFLRNSDHFDSRVFWIVLPFSIFFMYLFYTHYLIQRFDGFYCGGNTYGDLPFHLGIITSLKEQQHFPPQYSIFPGMKMGYPFFIDSLSSSLYLLGMSLRHSLLFPSAYMAILLIFGFVIFSYEVLKKLGTTTIATLLFFINGGLGFFYYFPSRFHKILIETVDSPTHLFDQNIIWSNVICDLLLPQRTTLGGWAFLLMAFWCLYRAINTSQWKYYFLSGFIAGLMPMIHTHSFLAYGIVAMIWFLYSYPKAENKKLYFLQWMSLVLPAFILSIPQLIYWTLPQSTSRGFVRLMPGWANQGDIWPWFWVKNTGLFFIILLFALFSPKNRLKSFYLPAVILFILAEFIVFQPWAWDNIKIFFVWYMFSVIFVSHYLEQIAMRISKRSVRYSFIGIVVGICILSGTFSLIREALSSFQLFSKNDIEIAEYIRNTTPADAVFLTSDFHNNPISALAGRNIVMGYEGWLWSHGIDYQERAQDVKDLFLNSSNFQELQEKYHIDYIYISSKERAKFGNEVNRLMNQFPIIYRNRDKVILSVSERARQLSGLSSDQDSN